MSYRRICWVAHGKPPLRYMPLMSDGSTAPEQDLSFSRIHHASPEVMQDQSRHPAGRHMSGEIQSLALHPSERLHETIGFVTLTLDYFLKLNRRLRTRSKVSQCGE